MDRRGGRPDRLHRAGLALGERLHREFQRAAARRAPERGDLLQSQGSTGFSSNPGGATTTPHARTAAWDTGRRHLGGIRWLACFHGVTAAGCAHDRIVVGSGKASVERPEFRWVNTMLGNIKSALRGTLPCDSTPICPALSLGVRIPLQSSLRPARHHPQTCLCRPQNAAQARTATQGCA